MKLYEAQDIINEVKNKSYSWMAIRGPGIDLIQKAVRTIEKRKSATDIEKKDAYDIKLKIRRR